MALIALYADQAHLPGAAGRNTGIVHPAAPAAPKLDRCEAPLRQVYGPEGRGELGHISMPVSGNGRPLDLSSTAVQELGEEFWIDDHSEIVGEVVWA
jgi:hypothetical protein